MPFADIKCIREVSSEDSNFKAENLIKHTAKKWKTRTCGERVAYVVLELSEPQIITGIDIGNEHSAFIEVLVSKTCCSTNNFTEILVTCSFMTLIESKNSTNVNRVRCFGRDALVPTATSEKWQFIKVICSQPFNKHVQYGISFIKLRVDSEPNKKITSLEHKKSITTNDLANVSEPLNTSQLGKFRMREESPESESESSSSLFKRWKASEMNNDSKSSPIEKKSVKTKEPVNKNLAICLDRNRKELGFGSEETSGGEILSVKKQRLLETIEIERHKLQAKTEKSKVCSDSKKPIKPSSMENKSHENIEDKAIKRLDNKSYDIVLKQSEKRLIFRPFNELLKGTVLVISGIQNPDRSDIRDKALSMGARYKADWGTDCTHLICAFKNTPKYNQVRGKGRIVTRDWIEDCYKQKKCLHWRRYALDSSDLNQPHSEEEVLDESLRPIESSVNNTISKELDLKVPTYNLSNRSINYAVSSGSDTDDDIQRVLQSNTHKPNIANETKISRRKGDFDVSTEEEDFLDVKANLVRKAMLK
uniref:DNA repair protein XRCC1 n=1 Tax=Bactrocera latifrons TaxID=174628 RepID=A0A0K8U2M4_BACLA